MKIAESDFQKRMHAFLRETCAEFGLPYEREEFGIDELGLKYSFPNSDFDVWIYEDGANILGKDCDLRFEIYDFNDLGSLEQALRRDCREKLMSLKNK